MFDKYERCLLVSCVVNRCVRTKMQPKSVSKRQLNACCFWQMGFCAEETAIEAQKEGAKGHPKQD